MNGSGAGDPNLLGLTLQCPFGAPVGLAPGLGGVGPVGPGHDLLDELRLALGSAAAWAASVDRAVTLGMASVARSAFCLASVAAREAAAAASAASLAACAVFWTERCASAATSSASSALRLPPRQSPAGGRQFAAVGGDLHGQRHLRATTAAA